MRMPPSGDDEGLRISEYIRAGYPAGAGVPQRGHPTSLDASDADLALATAGGSWASIGALYDRHRTEALAIAKSVLADPNDAEDVVHDMFVALPRMVRSYDPKRGTFSHWLSRSVRNRAIDEARRQSRAMRRTAGSADAVDFLASARDESLSPLAAVEAAELLDLVDRLDARRAHLIRLAFVEGWSHPMIARRTGLPLGTVKSRIRTGLAELRMLVIAQTIST
jgi:RNA polymerase sigma-70 factor (ECF subfamily)